MTELEKIELFKIFNPTTELSNSDIQLYYKFHSVEELVFEKDYNKVTQKFFNELPPKYAVEIASILIKRPKFTKYIFRYKKFNEEFFINALIFKNYGLPVEKFNKDISKDQLNNLFTKEQTYKFILDVYDEFKESNLNTEPVDKFFNYALKMCNVIPNNKYCDLCKIVRDYRFSHMLNANLTQSVDDETKVNKLYKLLDEKLNKLNEEEKNNGKV